MNSKLFSPFSMRGMTVPNRIMVSPMGQCSAENGCATDWHTMHVGNLAISGAGSVVLEATAVNPSGRHTAYDLGLWNDEQQARLAQLVSFARGISEARFGLQLWHVGRKGSVRPAWERHQPVSVAEGGWQVYSASDIGYPGRNTVQAMSVEMIRQTVQDFASAGRRADEAGIDFMEIHGAHGYLIHNFLSPITNTRTDAYGGSLENRMRFAIEVFEAVRAAVSDEKPVGMRLSATDWIEGGWSIEDSVILSKELKARGCDYITASSGGTSPEQKITVHPNYQVPFAERIRAEAGIATVAVGLITETQQAEDILAEGKADFVALARGIVYNPRWPWHAAIELGEQPTFPVQYERAHPAMRSVDFLKSRREV